MLELIIGCSLGVMAIIAMAVLKGDLSQPEGWVFLALLVATLGFLVHPLVEPSWRIITNILQTFIPALFWLLCQFAFRERPRIRSHWWLIVGYSAIVPAFYRLSPGIGTYQTYMQFGFLTVPGYLEYVLIGSGMWTVFNSWSDDLVESRRRLRALVVAVVGLSVLVNVVSVNVGWGGDIFQRWVVLGCLFVIASQMVHVPIGLLFGVVRIKTSELPLDNRLEEQADKTQRQLEQLKSLMLSGYYRNEKLTIAQLSSSLSIPEYIVRNLINEQLGYRNFNDYLNHWRIAEAKAQLIQESEKPVMNIALDLGYRTLSSFNRAFKDRTSKTPTQYRIQASESHESES